MGEQERNPDDDGRQLAHIVKITVSRSSSMLKFRPLVTLAHCGAIAVCRQLNPPANRFMAVGLQRLRRPRQEPSQKIFEPFILILFSIHSHLRPAYAQSELPRSSTEMSHQLLSSERQSSYAILSTGKHECFWAAEAKRSLFGQTRLYPTCQAEPARCAASKRLRGPFPGIRSRPRLLELARHAR